MPTGSAAPPPPCRIVALDMEWNQPVPWKSYPRVPAALMPGEIIQIGAVMLDERLQVCGELRLSVRPRYFRQVHWKVKKLTHISDEDMLSGIPFPEAAQQLGRWLTEPGVDFRIFAWGGEDERVLTANLEAWGMNPDWLPDELYDLRLIYDGLLGRTGESTSLTDAAAELGIDLDLTQHDSLNDARYAAAICARTDLTRGIDEYEELGSAASPPPAMQRLRLRGFASPAEVLHSEALAGFSCPACGTPLRCRSWTPQNKDRQIGLVSCSCGCRSLLRIRMSHRPDGSTSALRSVYRADEEAAAYYKKKLARQLEAQRRRKKAQEKQAAEAADHEN